MHNLQEEEIVPIVPQYLEADICNVTKKENISEDLQCTSSDIHVIIKEECIVDESDVHTPVKLEVAALIESVTASVGISNNVKEESGVHTVIEEELFLEPPNEEHLNYKVFCREY